MLENESSNLNVVSFLIKILYLLMRGFPGDASVKNLPFHSGDIKHGVSILGLGRTCILVQARVSISGKLGQLYILVVWLFDPAVFKL